MSQSFIMQIIALVPLILQKPVYVLAHKVWAAKNSCQLNHCISRAIDYFKAQWLCCNTCSVLMNCL